MFIGAPQGEAAQGHVASKIAPESIDYSLPYM